MNEIKKLFLTRYKSCKTKPKLKGSFYFYTLKVTFFKQKDTKLCYLFLFFKSNFFQTEGHKTVLFVQNAYKKLIVRNAEHHKLFVQYEET